MKAIISFMVISFCLVLTPLPGLCDYNYKISMLPKFSAEEINRRITPLAQHLAEHTGLTITPVIAASFAQHKQKLQSGAVHIGFTNPTIYTLVSSTHEVIAMADTEDGTHLRGVIITRSDSPIKTLDDLRGKRISFVSMGAAGGFLSQKLTLMEAGIDVRKDLTLTEAVENRHENVIFAVHTGSADAGFIRELALEQVDRFIPPSSIRVLAKGTWLPNWALSVNRTLPEDVKKKITEAIFALTPDSEAIKALRINKFIPAKDQDYNLIRKAKGIALVDVVNVVD